MSIPTRSPLADYHHCEISIALSLLFITEYPFIYANQSVQMGRRVVVVIDVSAEKVQSDEASTLSELPIGGSSNAHQRVAIH